MGDLSPDIRHWLSSFGVIFAIVDPFGFVPLFLSITAGDSDAQRKRTLLKACLIAFVILVGFSLVGNLLLGFFGISLPALQISGGIILLFVSLEMLQLVPFHRKLSGPEESEAVAKDDVSVVPLAIPMLAGPAALATVVLQAARGDGPADRVSVIVSIAVTLVFTYCLLRSAARVSDKLGVTGLNVLTRIMGLLLCAMAVEFVVSGYRAIGG